MSFLKDSQWENMDWLNQAVMPYRFSLFEDLLKIPDTFEITFEDLLITSNNHTPISRVRLPEAINHYLRMNNLNAQSFSKYQNIVGLFVKLSTAPGTKVNLTHKKIIGKIEVYKMSDKISDDAIPEVLRHLLYEYLDSPLYFYEDETDPKAAVKRIQELMDIFECKEGQRVSSPKKKFRLLVGHLNNIVPKNTWNIRDIDLIAKMILWVKDYYVNGNKCALANLSKLKCMTYNQHPIYSMEEII